MAATSTNKQPLLVDRVMHNVINLNTAAVGAIDVQGLSSSGPTSLASLKIFMQSHVALFSTQLTYTSAHPSIIFVLMKVFL